MNNKNLIERLVDIQSELIDPTKDANNPFFKSKYVPLDGFLPKLRELCSKHGVFITQCVSNLGDGAAELITRVSDGNSSIELARYPINVSKKPQETGSEITYARRYSLMPAFGLVGDEDDDGNAASQTGTQKPQTKRQQPKKPAPKTYEHDLTRLTEMKEDLAARAGTSQNEIVKALMAFTNKKPINQMDNKEFSEFLHKAEAWYHDQVSELDGTDEMPISEIQD